MITQYMYTITCDACSWKQEVLCSKTFACDLALWHTKTEHPSMLSNGVSMFDNPRTATALNRYPRGLH